MVLYTVAPPEQVFAAGASPAGRTETRPVPGGYVALRGGRVVCLCSTDPRQYLQACFAPHTPWNKDSKKPPLP